MTENKSKWERTINKHNTLKSRKPSTKQPGNYKGSLQTSQKSPDAFSWHSRNFHVPHLHACFALLATWTVCLPLHLPHSWTSSCLCFPFSFACWNPAHPSFRLPRAPSQTVLNFQSLFFLSVKFSYCESIYKAVKRSPLSNSKISSSPQKETSHQLYPCPTPVPHPPETTTPFFHIYTFACSGHFI